jgi:polyhydroxyalkanoate synthase
MAAQSQSSLDELSDAAQGFMKQFFEQLNTPTSVAGLEGQSTGPSQTAARLMAVQLRYFQEHAELLRSVLVGSGEAKGELADRSDHRFASPEWRRNPWFDFLRRNYLLNSKFAAEWVEALETDPQTKERLRFVTRQVTDAMSPSNFVATNPDVLKLALETQGESLAKGMRQLIDDVHKGRISTTDESKFEVGRNIAATEGAVVYQNDLIQLIQYKPLTDTVFKRPLVMVPPCINKYYILDLQPHNSLVRFAVEQGHTVFMVSWRNVTEAQGTLTWDDYVEQGPLKALEVAREICGGEKVNALGFCVGGTLLGVALAVAAAREEAGVESATFLAAMLDFSDTGEISLFVDEASVAMREATIGRGGILPSRDLALAFSSLRANDLVWSYVVNNYMKGKSPEAFDLLYWNADSTNLPGPMYCWYLRNTYLENKLRVAGATSVLGVPVDFGKIDLPAYILAAREDHIVPWRTGYQTTQLIRGDKRFVLGASGHVAGVVNPASKNKRSYWTGESLPANADEWFSNAAEKHGSWWNDWSEWLSNRGGMRIKARSLLGSTQFKPLEAAPGSYVKHRIT